MKADVGLSLIENIVKAECDQLGLRDIVTIQ
jgi:hypothetical protein